MITEEQITEWYSEWLDMDKYKRLLALKECPSRSIRDEIEISKIEKDFDSFEEEHGPDKKKVPNEF